MKHHRRTLIILILLAAILIPLSNFTPSVYATIARDSSCSGSSVTDTITCSLTHGASVFVIGEVNHYNDAVVTATVGATSLSIITNNVCTNDACIDVFGGNVAGSGTDTVTVTLGHTPPNVAGMEVVAFSGVDPSTPYSDATWTGDGGESSSPKTITITVTPSTPITGQMYVILPSPSIYTLGTAIARTGASTGQTVDGAQAVFSVATTKRGVAIGYKQDDASSLTLTQTWTFSYTGSYQFEWEVYGLILHPTATTSTGTATTTTNTTTFGTTTTTTGTGTSTSTVGTTTTITTSSSITTGSTTTTQGNSTFTTTGGITTTFTFTTTTGAPFNILPRIIIPVIWILIPAFLFLVILGLLGFMFGAMLGTWIATYQGQMPVWIPLTITFCFVAVILLFRDRAGFGGILDRGNKS